MDTSRTEQYVLHIYPIGSDDVSEEVRVIEVPLDTSVVTYVGLNFVTPRDSVFKSMTTLRRIWHDVVVHTVATTP
mgnify:CR=1 FL=1